jgi:hypothetical protein
MHSRTPIILEGVVGFAPCGTALFPEYETRSPSLEL